MTAFGGIAGFYQEEKELQIMFETTGVINEKLLKEIKNQKIKMKKQKKKILKKITENGMKKYQMKYLNLVEF